MEWRCWEQYFELEEALWEDAQTGQSSQISIEMDEALERAIEHLMGLGYSRESIEEYGLAWLELTGPDA